SVAGAACCPVARRGSKLPHSIRITAPARRWNPAAPGLAGTDEAPALRSAGDPLGRKAAG
ncbi:MAG TPA: hypothetical protein VFM36_16790, partial [Thermoanaerobaculia bacterium]|nr:hypothetical protein [Thermoanaerobaculia bacterium]